MEKLAKDIGLSEAYLLNMARRSNKHYKSYYQIKKNGGDRLIESPGKHLKSIQKWLLKNFFYNFDVHDSAHGFVKSRGIKTNASMHLGNSYLLCMDFKDFFTSIKTQTVLSTLKKLPIDNETARVVCNLCCYKSRLPQGGVCSPVISNLVMKKHDQEIQRYSESKGVTYTRYADDLAFSSNNFEALKAVEIFITTYFKNTFLKINTQKTRYLSRNNRLMVTGINLNKMNELSISSKQKNRLKVLIHHYFIKGNKECLNEMLGLYRHIIDIQPSYKSNLLNYINKIKSKRK